MHVGSADAVGRRAVALDWGGRLRVAHLGEGCADENSLMDIEENCTDSATAAEAMTMRMVWHLVSIGPLGEGVGKMLSDGEL